jgi:transposase-like protein
MRPEAVITDKGAIHCPSCAADATYRYGRIKTGKQRYICLMCGKQFILGANKPHTKNKPVCPECKKPMNIYKLEGNIIRFRCSDYPGCKTFKKFTLKEEA